MAITPQTNIKLLKCPLTLDNKNQLTFTNKNAQYTYFNSLPSLDIDNCQYQRKDSIIRYPAHIDSIIEYNYCMYQNDNYSDKWFYAFITNMRYVNDNMTEITIATDVWQTWQFDLVFKPSFIEREHVNDDTIGLNTIDENLNTGEMIEIGVQEDTAYTAKNYIAIECSYDPYEQKQNAGISVYNGTVFGNKIYLFEINALSDFRNVYIFMDKILYDNQLISNIQNIFFVPEAIVNPLYLVQRQVTVGTNTATYYELLYNNEAKEINHSYAKPYSFTDYTPKNNKCYVYPYNYLFVSNNSGNHNIFKYEEFAGNNVTFKSQLVMAIGVSGRLVPINYKNMPTCDDEALPLAKFPVCAWSSDAFTNWLTQNAVNIATNTVFGLAGFSQNNMQQVNPSLQAKNAELSAGQLKYNEVMSNVGMGLNIARTIADEIGAFYSASLLPNIQGGQPTGDVNFVAKRNTFTFRFMRSKLEYLKIIDDFFTMYGYKVNTTKIPNIIGRENWNYVKTVDINILGNLPQNDLQQIKNMFDNGLTLWHNPQTFLDYSTSNSIL